MIDVLKSHAQANKFIEELNSAGNEHVENICIAIGLLQAVILAESTKEEALVALQVAIKMISEKIEGMEWTEK
jgi:hypothetical protein